MALTKRALTAAQAAKVLGMNTPYGIAKVRVYLEGMTKGKNSKLIAETPKNRKGPGRIPTSYRMR